jgi:hypothetical protein
VNISTRYPTHPQPAFEPLDRSVAMNGLTSDSKEISKWLRWEPSIRGGRGQLGPRHTRRNSRRTVAELSAANVPNTRI